MQRPQYSRSSPYSTFIHSLQRLWCNRDASSTAIAWMWGEGTFEFWISYHSLSHGWEKILFSSVKVSWGVSLVPLSWIHLGFALTSLQVGTYLHQQGVLRLRCSHSFINIDKQHSDVLSRTGVSRITRLVDAVSNLLQEMLVSYSIITIATWQKVPSK